MAVFDWTHRINLAEEIQEIYLHRFLFTLGLGLVTIFIPLYLYDLGFSIPAILLFYAVRYATGLFLNWPVAKLAAHIGYKHTSFLSSPFYITLFLLLRAVDTPTPAIYLLAVLDGFAFTIYWIGMNSEMGRNSHDDHRGTETGIFFSMPLMASIFSPFIGGLVLAVYGFSLLFLVTVVLIAVSYLPFLLTREHYSGMQLETAALFSDANITDFLAYASRGATGLGIKVVWPLYLAVVITGALNVGGSGSLMAMGGTLANLLLGKVVTPGNRARVMAVGAFLLGGTFIGLSFVTTPLYAFIGSFLVNVVYTAVILPLYAVALDQADHQDIIGYFAYRELGLNTGRMLTLFFLIAVFAVLPVTTAFLATFAFIAVAAVCTAFFGARIT